MPQIIEFIQILKESKPPPNSINPYQQGSAVNADRCHNLQHYLDKLAERKPTHILIGEAPGHRGCRLSGIPFVSPYLLVNGVPACDLFGPGQGFVLPGDCTAVTKEASATIVWQTIESMQPIPLLWNAFPFHPHEPGQPQSNRSPTQRELTSGIPFLELLTALFQQASLVAIGKKAQQLLSDLQWPHHAVRHPSYGGKTAFVHGLKEIIV